MSFGEQFSLTSLKDVQWLQARASIFESNPGIAAFKLHQALVVAAPAASPKMHRLPLTSGSFSSSWSYLLR